jgi:RimJ/RimL family protein N-acetyltransferase
VTEIVTERLCLRPLRAAELCGDCAVRIEDAQRASAEIGVTLAPEHQGRGLAGEALGAVMAARIPDAE